MMRFQRNRATYSHAPSAKPRYLFPCGFGETATLFANSYLNGLVDGLLWVIAKTWKGMKVARFR